MKKKIYYALLFLMVCFLAGGLYITSSIHGVKDRLETIITLQKIEFLRENLLNKVAVVQADLLLKDTPHYRELDTFVKHVEEMNQAADQCTGCHHAERVSTRIMHIQQMIGKYNKKLSRVYTLRANEARLQEEKKNAYDLGQATKQFINGIIISSTHKTTLGIKQARQNVVKTERILYGFMIIGPLIIIFFVFYFFKNFTQSVTALTRATRKIKNGELSFRIGEPLQDEFHELAASFNEMAVSLKEQQQLTQQAERLAAVGELAAGLAHEVKNPLAGIKVSIEVLKNELPLEQEDHEIFLRVINEIRRIEALLKSLLNYARPSKPQPAVINLHEILEAIIKTSEFTLRGPGAPSSVNINFVKDFDTDVREVCADPAQLQQVLLNLVLNGIDAISEKGTITIKTVRVKDNFIEVLVSDTGKGIDPEALEMVFKPFFTSKSKGTGLGLAICKRLVEQNNGSISVFNNPEGGATFVITLPVKQECGECEP